MKGSNLFLIFFIGTLFFILSDQHFRVDSSGNIYLTADGQVKVDADEFRITHRNFFAELESGRKNLENANHRNLYFLPFLRFHRIQFAQTVTTAFIPQSDGSGYLFISAPTELQKLKIKEVNSVDVWTNPGHSLNPNTFSKMAFFSIGNSTYIVLGSPGENYQSFNLATRGFTAQAGAIGYNTNPTIQILDYEVFYEGGQTYLATATTGSVSDPNRVFRMTQSGQNLASAIAFTPPPQMGIDYEYFQMDGNSYLGLLGENYTRIYSFQDWSEAYDITSLTNDAKKLKYFSFGGSNYLVLLQETTDILKLTTSWTSVSTLPTNMATDCQVFEFYGSVYLLVGYTDGSSQLVDLFKWNEVEQEFIQISSIPSITGVSVLHLNEVTINSKRYIVVGTSGSESFLYKLDFY